MTYFPFTSRGCRQADCFSLKRLWSLSAGTLVLAAIPAAASAQQSLPTEDLKITPAPAIATRAAPQPPKIDGHLYEEAWTTARVISDFTQRDPDEGEPGTERTEVRVLYTNAALFVAVRAWDSEADKISGHLTRRDDWSPSDWIGIGIDSYHDRRTAFYFAVNAAGVKRDVYLYNDDWEDDSWDAVWDVATSRDHEGWTAEFRIPFSQLRFPKAESNTFGFNVYRRINRLNEEQYWRLPPKEESGMVSRFGDLEGIEGISPPRRIEVLPYVSGTAGFEPAQDGNPFQTGRDRTATGGADLNIGVTSNLTLSATINPDFGQVDADPAVVNLSAFETFFPERRPFFNEGLDMFRFGLGGGNGAEQLFYTRRIGRAPQGSADPRGGYAEQINHTTILGAAKLTGKTSSGWTLGLTGALTAEEEAGVIDSTGAPFQDPVEPRTGYLIGRVARDFRDGNTQIGLTWTATHRSLPDNLMFLRRNAISAGLNWTHRFADRKYEITGFVASSRVGGSEQSIEITQRSSARYYQRPDNDYVTFDPTRTSLMGFAADLNFNKVSGNWRFGTGVGTRSPGFEVNDVGFQTSADWTVQWVWLQRRWLKPGKVFRRFYINANQWAVWNYGWDKTELGGNVNLNYQLWNYWGGYAGIGRNTSALSTRTLRGGPAFTTPAQTNGWAGFRSDQRKVIRGGINAWFGDQAESGSWNYGVGVNLSWRPASNLDFTVAPSLNKRFNSWQYLQTANALGDTHYVFGELRQTTTSMRFRGNITFTPTMSLQLYAEPFISTGNYVAYRQIDDPRADTFAGRFDDFDDDRLIEDADGNISIDLDQSGTADINLGNPDFTFLSFRSNVVLRWEYMLGSTLFLVWQHGRSDSNDNEEFQLRSGVSDMFNAPSTNTFVVKVNYWLSL